MPRRHNKMLRVKRGQLITADMLKGMNACENQIIKFRREWPRGARLFKKNLLRAAELNMDLMWWASHVGPYSRVRGVLHKLIRKMGVSYFARRNWVDGRARRHYPEAQKAIALKIWEWIR
jgi:hypothetical protein